MQAIKELADRLDGKPAQMLEHSGPDSNPIRKVINEFVHVHETREELLAAEEPVLIEWRAVRDGNGSGGPSLENPITPFTPPSVNGTVNERR